MIDLATTMPGSAFIVEPLAPAAIDPAYVLIRLTLPEVTLPTWRRFARRMAGNKHGPRVQQGILTIRRRERPYPCGLIWYRREHDLARGHVLAARHLVVHDILETDAAMRILLAALADIARAQGCRKLKLATMQKEHLAVLERADEIAEFVYESSAVEHWLDLP